MDDVTVCTRAPCVIEVEPRLFNHGDGYNAWPVTR